MPFKRDWNEKCPLVFDEWEAGGCKWVAQDLAPEDDELAVKILKEMFMPDEILCVTTNILKDPVSMEGSINFWREALKQRTSIGCYRVLDGVKELVALNVCPMKCKDKEESGDEIPPGAWKNIVAALSYCDAKVNYFEALQVDACLGGAGLVVRRDVRGARLGARILNAREALCRAIGVKATITLFTVPPSQKLAARVGFFELGEVSFAELHRNVQDIFPDDPSRVMKIMAKKYDF